MGLEQVIIVIGGWFTVGFLLAVAVGKRLRQVDELDSQLYHAVYGCQLELQPSPQPVLSCITPARESTD